MSFQTWNLNYNFFDVRRILFLLQENKNNIIYHSYPLSYVFRHFGEYLKYSALFTSGEKARMNVICVLSIVYALGENVRLRCNGRKHNFGEKNGSQ